MSDLRSSIAGRGDCHTPDHAIIDDAALAEALRPVILKLGRLLRREAQKLDVSTIDAQLIAIVGRHPGIGVSELAAFEQVSSPSMSAQVKRLVAAGWLERDPVMNGDKRRVRLLLTAKARHSLAAIRQRRNDWLIDRIALLGAPERAALAAAVEPIARLLEMRP